MGLITRLPTPLLVNFWACKGKFGTYKPPRQPFFQGALVEIEVTLPLFLPIGSNA